MIRLGMLTSGGDCQALNAAMRGVAKGLFNSGKEIELFGFLDGYKGLIYGNYKELKPVDFSGILQKAEQSLEARVCRLRQCVIQTKMDLIKWKR